MRTKQDKMLDCVRSLASSGSIPNEKRQEAIRRFNLGVEFSFSSTGGHTKEDGIYLYKLMLDGLDNETAFLVGSLMGAAVILAVAELEAERGKK